MRVRVLPVVLAIAIGLVITLALKNEGLKRDSTPAVRTIVVRSTATPTVEHSLSTRVTLNDDATVMSDALTTTTPSPTSTRVEIAENGAMTPEANFSPYVGLWLSPEEAALLPAEGTAWNQLLSVANQEPEEPDLYDKDNDADVQVLARALVYARIGDPKYRSAVLDSIEAVMDQEFNPRRTSILSVARNLPAYIVAADLVDLAQDESLDSRFRLWLHDLSLTVFSGDGGSHTIASCHERRPNNFGSHCGATRVAIALYLGDEPEVERAAMVFHGWLGNRQAYTGFEYGRLTWQADPEAPVGINPPGATKSGYSIAGALPEEMRRGGDFRWPPKRTGYAWEALQGALVQAELLSRAGYSAWDWEDRALLRAVEFLHELGWDANGDDSWQPWLINYVYDTDFPAAMPARPGKNMGWTDWTHGPERAALTSETATSTENQP